MIRSDESIPFNQQVMVKYTTTIGLITTSESGIKTHSRVDNHWKAIGQIVIRSDESIPFNQQVLVATTTTIGLIISYQQVRVASKFTVGLIIIGMSLAR